MLKEGKKIMKKLTIYTLVFTLCIFGTAFAGSDSDNVNVEIEKWDAVSLTMTPPAEPLIILGVTQSEQVPAYFDIDLNAMQPGSLTLWTSIEAVGGSLIDFLHNYLQNDSGLWISQVSGDPEFAVASPHRELSASAYGPDPLTDGVMILLSPITVGSGGFSGVATYKVEVDVPHITSMEGFPGPGDPGTGIFTARIYMTALIQ